jgi:DNA adenine methylase
MSNKINKLRPPVKIHGGKYYLAKWVIDHFPKDYEQYDYIEPFCGAASVFINKEKSIGMEVVSDIDLGMIQIWRALRDEPGQFIGRIKRTKYSERVFKRELKKSPPFDDYMDHAVHEYILRRMSRGGLKKAFAWSNRLRGGQPGDVNAWETMKDYLHLIAERTQDCYIFYKPALDVVNAFNTVNTLCYCDPTYLHETRESKDAYEFEVTTDDHIALAEKLNQFKGKVAISGYPSALYNRLFKDWRCVRKRIANHASQSSTKKKKTECLWMNY